MKKTILTTLITLVATLTAISQNYIIQYDFEQPQQINDWLQANSDDFGVSSDAPISGNYSLKHTTPNTSAVKQAICIPITGVLLNNSTTTWMFKFKYNNNNPSGSNKFYVYLMSDKDYSGMIDPSNSKLNGYVFGVNFGSTTDDFLKIWRIKNGTSSVIINSNVLFDASFQDLPVAVKITRTQDGLWNLQMDTLTADYNNVISFGTATNTEITDFQFAGFTFFFTSTFAGKIRFDDFYFSGYKLTDTIKPQLLQFQLLSNNLIKLTFSEIVSGVSATNTANYFIDNGIGNPVTATLDQQDKRIVTLTFANNFVEFQNYNLTIRNIADLENNIMNDTTVSFYWEKIKLERLTLIDKNKIDLFFTKTINEPSTQNLSNYLISDTITVTQASVDATNKKLLHLTLSHYLKNGNTYTLKVKNIADNYEIPMNDTTLQFLFYLAQPFDIVINELMVDINPAPTALPPYKYIEIYNKTPYKIDLSNWKLKIGTNSDINISNFSFNPNSYAIICSQSAQFEFAQYGPTIPILVESQLTSTTGKTILLKDHNGNIIEQITYDPKTWYNDPVKDDGGWSMERIDPNNVCSQSNNWTASMSYTGGTPGFINSVYGTNPDTHKPYVIDFKMVTSHDIMIEFSETIDAQVALQQINYILNDNTIPLKVRIDPNNPARVFIYFIQQYLYGYNSLKVSGISDYCGNKIKDTVLTFYYQLVRPTDVEPKSDFQLKIYFTEPVSKSTSQNIYAYQVNEGIGYPTVALRDPNDSNVVHLQFSKQFQPDKQYIISIQYIKDLYGHQMESANIAFTYHIPKMFDIVVNELMLDVNPAPAALPACQYIEIFNTSQFDIWLTDWQFIAEGQSPRTFPTVKIPSRKFALICNSEYEKIMKQYGTVIPILGSSDLTQSGKKIEIFDNKSQLIYTLRYTSAWYKDKNKDDGGWSLEKIDPDNFCETSFNWQACNDIIGGTPGRDNSVFKSNPDTTKPVLLSVVPQNSRRLLLQFSKDLSFDTGLNPNNYLLDNQTKPTFVSFSDTSRKIVYLLFQNQLNDQHTYTFDTKDIKDDCGNYITPTQKQFTYKRIYLTNHWILNNNQIQLVFSEEVDLFSSTTSTNYTIDNQIGNPASIVRSTTNPNIIFLQFTQTFSDGQYYNLQITGIKDINNNTIRDTTIQFVYYIAKPRDIVINELLFNPFPNCVDYVELYNNSTYPINLKDLRIGNRNTQGAIGSFYNIVSDNTYFLPKTFIVLTTDTNNIKTIYPYHGKNFIQLKNIPSYPDDKGTVVIFDYKDTIIDEFSYTDKMHFKLLSNKEGVALERIDYNRPTNDPRNWTSASSFVKYGTPGLQNSQYKKISDTTTTENFAIEPDVISPDNDGLADQLYIYYSFDEVGYVANVQILDKNGQTVRKLTSNEYLGTKGFWLWDGLDDNSQRVKMGIYLVVIKYFDLNGNPYIYRKPFVISYKR